VGKGATAAERSTYLDVIERVRRERGDGQVAAAEPTRKARPPRAARGYPRRQELQRDLERYYERCKDQNAGRFKSGKRTKSYCSAVAWTVARKSGRYPDYPTFQQPNQSDRQRSKPTMKPKTPPRDPRTGLFRKTKHRARAAEPTRRRAPRRARRSAPRRHNMMAGAPRPRRAPRRRSAPRRSRSTNIAIVPVGVREHGPRRRRSGGHRRSRRHSLNEMFAWDAPKASGGGIAMLLVGSVVGAEIADIIHRYCITYASGASTAPTPTRDASITTVAQYNQAALGAKLFSEAGGYYSAGAQVGLTIIGILGGIFLPWAPLKMFSYGVAVGSFTHLAIQILNNYVVEPMFAVGTATVSPTGARLFAFENIAAPASAGTVAGSTTTNTGWTGAPMQRSAVAAGAPVHQPKDRVPATLGAPGVTAAGALAPGGGGVQRPLPTPVYVAPGGTPPTNTQTQVPPTNTQTQVPPTNTQTQVPPTNTQTQTPGGGPQKPCKKGGQCGPDCSCSGGNYGDPPKPAPHPLFAALRAA